MYGYEELVAFGKANVEAMVKSSALAAKGFEELTKSYAGYGVQSMEAAGNVVKELGACKTPVDFAQLQAKLVRASVEDGVAESRKLAELTTAVVNTALEPLAARFRTVIAQSNIAMPQPKAQPKAG